LSATDYIGRFAPTPSGPLHFGSIVAAAGSWLDARACDGKWKLRIDDLDAPRVVPGVSDSILRVLEGYGLIWDGDPVLQSKRFDKYETALEKLKNEGRTYGCNCTRKNWSDSNIYPTTCRDLALVDARSTRFISPNNAVKWQDLECGYVSIDVPNEVGDFLLQNAHGTYSYQIANAVDDVEMGVTDVVRGADLLSVTAAHILVQESLRGASIRYRHLPLALTPDGKKISKSSSARGVEVSAAPRTLQSAFNHLGLGLVSLDRPEAMLKEALAKWKVRA